VSWSRTLKVRQLLRAQLEAGEEIALLFSDIRGFSAYAAEMGDRAAFRLTQLHEGILKDCILEYGILVKSLGDGVMAAFETPALAISAAV
jgi:class 3 adenylate cyclase